MLLPGSLMMDWQLEAVFREHCFSWEFVRMTWAPRVASGLLRGAEQTHNCLYRTLPSCGTGLVPPRDLCKQPGARQVGWCDVDILLQC